MDMVGVLQQGHTALIRYVLFTHPLLTASLTNISPDFTPFYSSSSSSMCASHAVLRHHGRRSFDHRHTRKVLGMSSDSEHVPPHDMLYLLLLRSWGSFLASTPLIIDLIIFSEGLARIQHHQAEFKRLCRDCIPPDCSAACFPVVFLITTHLRHHCPFCA